jgi:serine/threonine-protein kinase
MTHIGKYELHDQIGKGGFGTVYKAVDPLGRIVAIKILHPGWSNESAVVERFKREVVAAGSLFHPNIATILDAGEDDGRLFLVMRYIDGISLNILLQETGPLGLKRSTKILVQISEAMDFAYKNGFLHRDIKPANILIDKNDNAVLTDFGLVRATETSRISTTNILVGSPSYIAPEIWDGQPGSMASDVYSLACVFFEMLTGKILFNGDSPVQIMTRHVVSGPQFPQKWPEAIPDRVIDELSRALSKDLSERFATAGEFSKAIQLAQTDQISAAPVRVDPITDKESPSNGNPDQSSVSVPIQPPVHTPETTPSSKENAQPDRVITAQNRKKKTTVEKNRYWLYGLIGLVVVLFFLFGYILIAGLNGVSPIPSRQAVYTADAGLSAANQSVTVHTDPTQLPTHIQAQISAPRKTTAVPTKTVTFTRADTYTFVPTDTLTSIQAQPSVCEATTIKRAHLRAGPGENYVLSQYLDSGSLVSLLGQNSDGSWVYGRMDTGLNGWISTIQLELNLGNCTLPVLENPPTATPRPVTAVPTSAPVSGDDEGNDYP